MIKLAILGTENSHAWYFSSMISPKEGEGKYPGIELIGVYGDPNDEQALKGIEKVKEVSLCNRFADNYNDFLDEADAVMITTSNGAKHLEYAESYLKRGKFVWVDKPTTWDPVEAVKMWELAEENGAVLCGGSTMRYDEVVQDISRKVKGWNKPIMGGNITAPLIIDEQYGGFWFYSQHLVEIMVTIFGTEVQSVSATKEGDVVRAVYRYEGFDVSALYGTGFSAVVYLNGGETYGKSFDLSAKYYEPPMENFYKVIKNKQSDKTKKEFISSAYIIDATIKSFSCQREIEVNIPNC